ncbi:hypothetical protein CARUB_v10022446mg [Capsella rubella]|uniref:Uncharacterized protein n=1 Tax=Capsella rubella TaxID=81985 RepID=R0HY91_9BRAS|nr:hypothetical protein CARUB_v10022446mg [Capsella rubella]
MPTKKHDDTPPYDVKLSLLLSNRSSHSTAPHLPLRSSYARTSCLHFLRYVHRSQNQESVNILFFGSERER